MSIFINKEIRALIPPLSDEELEQLEENIVAEVIRDPLITWPQPDGREMLIDGHNRFDISCRHNGIPFEVKRMNFRDMDEAKIWMIRNQFGRRNLTPYERSVLALKLEPLIAEKAKEQQGARTDISQKSVKSHDTQKELAAIAGVSHDTIHKVKTIESKAPEKLKEQVRSGEKSINKAYNEVMNKDVKRPPSAEEYRERVRERHEALKEQKTVNISDIARDRQDVELLRAEVRKDFIKALQPVKELYLKLDAGEIDLSLITDIDRAVIVADCTRARGFLLQIMEIIGGV